MGGTPQRPLARRLSTTKTADPAKTQSASRIRVHSTSTHNSTTGEASTPMIDKTARRPSSVIDTTKPAQAPRTRRLSEVHSIVQDSASAMTRPSSTPRSSTSRRLSTSTVDLDSTTVSTTSRVEIGETPHLPRYMVGTVSSKAGATPAKKPSKIPVRVAPQGTSRGVTPSSSGGPPSRVGSIASLNELSFSSGRCGPVKRSAKYDTKGEELDEDDVVIHPKRRRFDENSEATALFSLRTIKEMSDEEKVREFTKKWTEMDEIYEKEIRPILERRERERITVESVSVNGSVGMERSPASESLPMIDDVFNGDHHEVAPMDSTMKLEPVKVDEPPIPSTPKSAAVLLNQKIPKTLLGLMSKHPCIRDALTSFKKRTQSE